MDSFENEYNLVRPKKNKFTLDDLIPNNGTPQLIVKKGEQRICENINKSINELEKSRVTYHDEFYAEDNPAVTFSKFKIKRRINYVKQNQRFLNSALERDFISKSAVAVRTVVNTMSSENTPVVDSKAKISSKPYKKLDFAESLLKQFENEF